MSSISPASKRRKRVITAFQDDGMTQQHFKDECDINNLIAKYIRGDDMSRYQRTAQYLGEDFPTSMSLTDAENIIRKADNAFYALPAQDRDFFENDPNNFITYMEKPEFIEDSIKRGYRQVSGKLPPATTPEPKAKKGSKPPSPPSSEDNSDNS